MVWFYSPSDRVGFEAMSLTAMEQLLYVVPPLSRSPGLDPEPAYDPGRLVCQPGRVQSPLHLELCGDRYIRSN